MKEFHLGIPRKLSEHLTGQRWDPTIIESQMCFRHSVDAERFRLGCAVRNEPFVPLANKITIERRCFSCAGSSLWNALSQIIRGFSPSLHHFQSKLKAFLYHDVYHL